MEQGMAVGGESNRAAARDYFERPTIKVQLNVAPAVVLVVLLLAGLSLLLHAPRLMF